LVPGNAPFIDTEERTMADKGGKNRRTPQLLERTFAILDLFTLQRPDWTTTEVATKSKLPVPTVHRILTALEEYGYVARNGETRRFRLGTAALSLGRNARAATDLRVVSLPVLQQLSRETDETALLTVISEQRDASVCLERVESTRPLRLSVEPGRRLPLHAGASQKALLAYMLETEIERILESSLRKLCVATISDPDELRAELKKIRNRGYATSFQETDLGVWGIAMCLLDEEGRVVASIGLAGPQTRLRRPEVARSVEVLARGAEAVAERLALRPSYARNKEGA